LNYETTFNKNRKMEVTVDQKPPITSGYRETITITKWSVSMAKSEIEKRQCED
jgi:hypothetical protein